MNISIRGLMVAALMAILLAGCGLQPSIMERRTPDDPQQLLQQAEEQGPAQAALTRLEAANILARQGSRTQALDVAKEIDDRQLEASERLRWALLLSELGEALDDPWAVIQAGQDIEALQPTPDQSVKLRERLGMALLEVDEPLAAAETLIGVQADTDQEALNDRIWDALTQLEARQLTSLESGANSLTQGWLDLVELFRTSGGDIQRLFDRLDDWRDRQVNHPAARRLPAELLALRELRGQEVSHIAVFLPESGPLSEVAAAIREGMRTHHLNEANQGNSARLTFIDSSHGDLEALYREAENRGAQVVVGPLEKQLVSELERRDEVPLPTLALNYGTSERNQTDNLFQYGLSAEDEARQTARRAWQDGHRSAVLLVPDNDWGGRVGEAYWEEWRDRGGEVTKAVRYDPQGSVANAVKPALNVSNERARLGNVDMLFLLALPEFARQVPPTLDYFYASELPVYATSHLYEGRLQPRLDQDLDDVRFIDIPWQIPDAAVGGEEALPFFASYRELREESDPAMFRLLAMGVDAYELARRLPQLQALPDSEVFGATGTLRPGEDGRILRQLPWARFVNGVPQPILIPGLFDRSTDDAESDQRDDDPT
ncbi:penicillin-binding protein activator [Halomonas sp. TRM85114]|uniref:penicillin-binding protein activator n=1 Tax=Halomonas jincaotanensis TaxID=2810616 RepID=UPI001BD4B34B|nr:penicillin-binding protein activator [Halomonas jincaotanensis]MBS9402086.1 penicillin-binding protein activator [Halomonas jincaotanensis]